MSFEFQKCIVQLTALPLYTTEFSITFYKRSHWITTISSSVILEIQQLLENNTKQNRKEPDQGNVQAKLGSHHSASSSVLWKSH